MAPPKLSEDEIDDLVYLARTGEDAELAGMLRELAAREGVTPAEVLEAARDEGWATCLHMAAANGHSKTVTFILSLLPVKPSSPISTAANPSPSQTSSSDTLDSTQQEEQEQQKQQQSSPSSDPAEQPEPSYIDARNSFGNTALHWACLGGHLDVAKLLLSRGARPAAANDKDQIPLDLAAFNGHMHVVDYFLSQSRDIEGSNAKEGGGEALAGGVRDVAMGEEDGGGEETSGIDNAVLGGSGGVAGGGT